jgi:hypothetical protein
MIAADVNRDGRVNLGDLVELRKVVLGVYSLLPNNTSWRFIDKAYQFKTVENALTEAYNEQYEIQKLNDNMTVDFVSVKVGDIDVNATTKANASTHLKSRSEEIVHLHFDDKIVEKGELVKVPVYLEKVRNFAGLQLGLAYNSAGLEFSDIEVKLPNASTNSGYVINEGVIKLSWNNIGDNNIKEVAIITFEAKARVQLSESLGNAGFLSQAYDSELKSYDLEMRSNTADKVSFELKQNIPNPFSEVTEISFVLPQTQTATLKVYDMKGSEVFKVSNSFEAGKNSILLNRKDIVKPGVYYYTLQVGENKATKKLVILD